MQTLTTGQNFADSGNQFQQSNASASPSDQKGPIFIGRFKYVARTAEDLTFDKNEKLMVIGGMEGDWWMARSLTTNKEGYIPRNYVAAAESYEAEE